jgi:hypothetical protein
MPNVSNGEECLPAVKILICGGEKGNSIDRGIGLANSKGKKEGNGPTVIDRRSLNFMIHRKDSNLCRPDS